MLKSVVTTISFQQIRTARQFHHHGMHHRRPSTPWSSHGLNRLQTFISINGKHNPLCGERPRRAFRSRACKPNFHSSGAMPWIFACCFYTSG